MRQYQTIADLKHALDQSRKAANGVNGPPTPGERRKLVKPGLLLDEDDLLAFIGAIEKRDVWIKRLKTLAKTTRDLTALLRAIEEAV